MLLLQLGLLLIFCGEPSRCQGDDGGFTFDGDLRHFAVASDTIYIATEKNLHQLNHNLTLVRRMSLRGVLLIGEQLEDGKFHRVSENDAWNGTFSVNVMLPFVANGTLIICGILDNGCGYCEVLKARDISEVQHRDYILVGPLMDASASVAFLATVQERLQNETYILTAIQQARSTDGRCTTGVESVVFLHDTSDGQEGGIFSDAPKPLFKNGPNSYAEFVDGFQIGSNIYLFSNVPSRARGNKVRLIWLKALASKGETMRSLRGATLRVPGAGDDRCRLLASSVIPGGPPVLWSGVFSVDGRDTDTVLVVFDISPDPNGHPVKDPDFCTEKTCDSKNIQSKTLIPKTVLFRQNKMTSVLAVRQRDFVLFFVGTGDGQLIKFAMDKNYHTSCPRVLYRSHDDRKVLPRLHLDEVDHKHVYVPFKNQVMRIPVTTCNTSTSLQECWSAQDPYCIWCDSTQSCTFEADCNGTDWLGIPNDFQQQKLVSYKTERNSSGQIILRVKTHLTIGPGMVTHFVCQFPVSFPLCHRDSPSPNFPQCTCVLSNNTLPLGGVPVAVRIRLGRSQLVEQLNLTSCSDITGPPTADLCRQCIKAGCGWSSNRCTWANQATTNASICQTVQTGMNLTKPEIYSISPNVVSFYGRNYAVLSGRNLRGVTRVKIQGHMDCISREFPVLDRTHETLTFHIPNAVTKGSVKVCVVLPDGSCVGNVSITYLSSPSCTDVTPKSAWMSGKRNITVQGSHLEFVEAVIHSHAMKTMLLPLIFNSTQLTFGTPEAGSALTSTVYLKVANETLVCSKTITYYPDPVFTHFTAALTGSDVSINIQKKADKLEMKTAELSVWGVKDGKQYDCEMENKETNNDTDFFICEIKNSQILEFQHLLIKYGDKLIILKPKSSHLILILLVLLLIPCIIVAVVIIYRRKQNQLTTEMNNLMENLELDIRNDIRQGFIDLQTEKADLLENVGAIPFLDYKHFASRIFFPESEALMASCIKDIGQDVEKVHLDECCHGLSKLIQDQLFLTSMVHALEEQKNFTIKDKCTLASLLTVALHSNLSYLTEVMEFLLKDLMQQTSNTQPKLLLRRTESIVEKLLTNWMSICLYGFLRENVGQHLFLMVSALTQQISKGPVDCVTEKALYTLSEDWLLWQAQDFSSLKLKVLFAVGTDGEVSEPLEVDALTCDTIEQVKEKILSTFKAKFGFPYNTPLRDIDIEFEKAGSFVRLEEVDASSEVLGDVTMLNTLKHYKVTDGATIKVLSKTTHPPLNSQGSLRDDQDFSGKYFHLIDPDVDEDQRKNPERKKLKLKEVHLTKLLSTKVAVHSFVENLFRCIWGMQQSKAPHAIKYFFDFLDAQSENMKITDPDVLHIWKTNSLPLRFWVNILKNPQFVFDMEKSPHLDGCLSVIAQAFMDSFSLSDTQLGKHTPTNKLLYTKDTPKFKQEVKIYYKQIREQQPITASEFKDFLVSESKKHDNEFNEAEALRELYKFVQKYFTEIEEKLTQSGAPSEIKEQLHHVKGLFDGLKSCSWN